MSEILTPHIHGVQQIPISPRPEQVFFLPTRFDELAISYQYTQIQLNKALSCS